MEHLQELPKTERLKHTDALKGVPKLNLTQHTASEEQIEDDVIDLSPELYSQLKKATTFTAKEGRLPDRETLHASAGDVLEIIKRFQGKTSKEEADPMAIMIGGAQYFLPILEKTLQKAGHLPVYAISEKDSKELEPGKKEVKFKHLGFYASPGYNDLPEGGDDEAVFGNTQRH